MTKLIAAAKAIAWCAEGHAQGQAAAQKPPAYVQGKPENLQSDLAPFPPKLTITPPAEVPVDKIKLPSGFKAELWAHGLPGAREMARGAKGKIYVGTRQIGRVYEVTDESGQRTVRTVVERLNQPAGVAFPNASLYVASIYKVRRYDGI